MRYLLLLVAAAAGYFSHAQTASQQPTGKVGYASVERIIRQLPDIKEIQSELQSTQTQLRNRIEAKTQEVQKQYDEFNANAPSMTDTTRAAKQRELEQAIADLEKMQQDARTTLENKQKLFMAPLYLKVNKAIQEVAMENGYEIILTDKISGLDFLLFSADKMDISNLVLQKFGVTPADQK